MEKIIIKNFGPIKEVELEIKDINVFIGSTSSGKSTVAKLIAISREYALNISSDFNHFIKLTVQYNVNFKVTNKTYIKYSDKDFYWELKNKEIKNNGVNWLVTRLLTSIDKLAVLMNPKSSSLSALERRKKLLGMFILSGGFEEIIELEHKASGRRSTKQVQALLDIIEEYKGRFDKESLAKESNVAVFNEAIQDARLLELLPHMDSEIGLEAIIYIPAERILLSMVAESLFGLMNHDVAIAKCIKDFGAQFESARKKLPHFSIPFLDAEYQYSNSSNLIAFSDGAKIKLEQASSGLQSVIPLLLVVEANTLKENIFKNYLLIEEPELNLYPTVQKELVEFIVERINKSKDKLILTTHSPYVLTSLDNLIQASNAAKAHPEQSKKVSEIVAETKWVDFDRVACYFFENGSCRSTLDQENQTIGASNIDDVSENLGKTFDQLLELKYAHVS